MDFIKLDYNDTDKMLSLIIDMYSNIENLEWMPVLPIDRLNVANLLTNSRYYYIGAFENNKLVGAGSLDFKCSNLFGVVQFPKEYNEKNLVQIGPSLVHSEYQGRGIMKEMVSHLTDLAKELKYEYIFSLAHKYSFASVYSFLHSGFNNLCDYNLKISRKDFLNLASQDYISDNAYINAERTLTQTKGDLKFPFFILVKPIK